MKTTAAALLRNLIQTGRIVEAREILRQAPVILPEQEGQELLLELRRLEVEAELLQRQARDLEQAGHMAEARAQYVAALALVRDDPELARQLKGLDKALTLAKAIRHRHRRPRQGITMTAHPEINTAAPLVAGGVIHRRPASSASSETGPGKAAGASVHPPVAWQNTTEKAGTKPTCAAILAPCNPTYERLFPALKSITLGLALLLLTLLLLKAWLPGLSGVPKQPNLLAPSDSEAMAQVGEQKGAGLGTDSTSASAVALQQEHLKKGQKTETERLNAASTQAVAQPTTIRYRQIDHLLPPAASTSLAQAAAPAGLPATPLPPSDSPGLTEATVTKITVTTGKTGQPAGGWYVVNTNDSLSSIASRQLCNPQAWQTIYRQNAERIQNPQKLYPGMSLWLGDLPNACLNRNNPRTE